MSKPTIVISCPIDTYSGYGARARDLVKAIVEIQKYDVKILPQRWGSTRWGYLKDHQDQLFTPLIIPELKTQPDIWMQITIPNEFAKIGKFNIGVTAGMETDLCPPSWVKGANNMDLILCSSNHSVYGLERSRYDMKDDKTGNITEKIELSTKLEVLFEGVDITKYFPESTPKSKTSEGINLKDTLDNIPENFCFLTTGHWMHGDFGEDRKNIGFTVKSFLETFKNKKNSPALIMKCHCATTSIMDRDRMLDKIDEVRKTVKGSLPNIYLVHGEVSDAGMNLLYNHNKVKALVSLPKGEGFGRPYLEFSLVNKPIIASGWSGHLDFLNKDYVRFVKGEVKKVHKSVLVKDIIIEPAQWFTPDAADVGKAYKDVYKNYSKWEAKAKRQGHQSRSSFCYDAMKTKLESILKDNVPDIPKQVQLSLPKLSLPKLKKVGNAAPAQIKLPKLKKI
tara:strand:- start:14821 stop:16170 length:1350 start_codon:yes stop_codon:yes gene_type:complete